MEEIWKSIANYVGYYSVSSHGRIRRDKPGQGARIDHFLRPGKNKKGYLLVVLCKDGIPKSRIVHSLVASTFLGPCPKGFEVNHKDGDKTNNHIENLEYKTHIDNIRHAHENFLTPKGESHGNAILKNADILKIREFQSNGLGHRKISRIFNVSRSAIRNIINGKSWNHI